MKWGSDHELPPEKLDIKFVITLFMVLSSVISTGLIPFNWDSIHIT